MQGSGPRPARSEDARRDAEQALECSASPLSDAGEGSRVGCSWGVAWVPSNATGPNGALDTADERMYARKASRATAGYQATAALEITRIGVAAQLHYIGKTAIPESILALEHSGALGDLWGADHVTKVTGIPGLSERERAPSRLVGAQAVSGCS